MVIGSINAAVAFISLPRSARGRGAGKLSRNIRSALFAAKPASYTMTMTSTAQLSLL